MSTTSTSTPTEAAGPARDSAPDAGPIASPDAALISVAPGARRARVGLRGAGIVPWLVSRGPATAWVAIGAGGALLLGGDSVRLDVRVASGCTLHIEDVGGTVAYDGEGRTATWDVRASLGDGARLTWRALPFVVADGASVERSMSVTLGAGASAIVRETLVLGRAGERGGTVVSRLDVTDAGGPLLVETLRVCGDAPVPGVLGTHRVVDSVLAVGAEAGGIPAVTDAPGATVLRLERGGHLVRALGTDAHVVDLAPVFDRFAG